MDTLTTRIRRLLPSLLLILAIILNAPPVHAQNLFINGEGVRLRSNPSLRAPILRKLQYRTSVKQLDREGDFQRVRLQDGVIGYIHTTYLSPTVPPPRPHIAESCIVWMNTRSWVFHNATCRWYENTRYGRHMTCEEASKRGRPCELCDGYPLKASSLTTARLALDIQRQGIARLGPPAGLNRIAINKEALADWPGLL